MNYCDSSELSVYVLQAYLNKVEELKPGSADGHITRVSAEINDAIRQGGYAIPDQPTATLTRICAVLSAWRCIAEITSLMDTEASSNNQWLPLQKLASQSEKDLGLIRAGKLSPGIEPDEETVADSGITVVAPKPLFDASMWEKF